MRNSPAGRLEGRSIALGVSGSIAAYKAPDLLRALQAEGADVRVLATRAGLEFVSELTLETLSHHPVDADAVKLLPDGRIGHIVAALEADVIVVAPATAQWLAAMANGLASDPITATCLAARCPVVVAPAMDGGMYTHPATQANVARLRSFGYRIVEPERGPLASGQNGLGRLAALPVIVDAAVEACRAREIRSDLAGRHLVVTAGGTAEALDPVRYIGNRSSGRMGMAIAEAALSRGARVSLIVGQMSVPLPVGAEVVVADTTEQMQLALRSALRTEDGATPFDALVMAAAVADFRPAKPSPTKLSRGENLTLELEPTPDLLAEVSSIVRRQVAGGRGRRPVLVGFAAETGSLDRVAAKVRAKGVDLLVANDVAEAGSGFGTETNRVTLYAADGEPDPWPLLSKREVADRLLDRIADLLTRAETRSAADPASPLQEVPT